VPKACNGSRSGSCNRSVSGDSSKAEVPKSEVAKTEVAAK
jgi:hypothetical protein